MKTEYLDKEIQFLNFLKRNNEISDYAQEKLNEFTAIKKQLLLHNVSISFLYDFVNKFTNTEIPKQAIKETLDELNER